MHIAVWIITPTTRPEDLDLAFREAEKITDAFHERNFSKPDPEADIMPPLRNDWAVTGNRYQVDLDPGPGNNWAFGKNAAVLPDNVIPKAVITPEGYAALQSGPEEYGEIRRVLLHLPDNIVVVQDWYY